VRHDNANEQRSSKNWFKAIQSVFRRSAAGEKNSGKSAERKFFIFVRFWHRTKGGVFRNRTKIFFADKGGGQNLSLSADKVLRCPLTRRCILNITKKPRPPIRIFRFLRSCSQVRASGEERAQMLTLYLFVVYYGSFSEWSFSENGRSSYAEMHFKSSKHDIYKLRLFDHVHRSWQAL